jgi:hypothetical protein
MHVLLRNWALVIYVKNMEDYAVKQSIFKSGPDNVNELMIGFPGTFSGILSINF